MIICLFTGLLTPVGDLPYTYLVKTMMGNTAADVNQHLPMRIINHVDILVFLAIIIVLLVCSSAKIKLIDVFMLTGLILLMFFSRRQLTIFVLVGGIILNKLLSQTVENYKEKDINFLMSQNNFRNPNKGFLFYFLFLYLI